MSVAIETEG